MYVSFRAGLGLLAALILTAGCATTSSERAIITERPPATTEAAESPEPEPQPVAGVRADTVQPGRFDYGKMWTFDNPPLDYFEETYGFRPSGQWLELASRAALRFEEGCSASFVSPRGLVMTNHHCARESITEVSAPDENLLDSGFYAETLEQERKVEDLYVDQLMSIVDVTDTVFRGLGDYQNDDDEAEARERRREAVENRMTREAKERDSTFHVQVIALYNGGSYSAYTFKRFEDIRLVMAPELEVGRFGGEFDNFTYPRYSLDMAFFRVYDTEGNPVTAEYYYPWSTAGARSGEPVFVVGNPGSTSRMSTVSQLEYQREYALPQQLDALRVRADILKTYIQSHPDAPGLNELRNTYYSMANSIKALEGQLAGLRDETLMARRRAAERMLHEAIQEDPKLKEEYGTLLNELAALQSSKKATAQQSGALTYFSSTSVGSRILTRALYTYAYTLLSQRGAPPDLLTDIEKDVKEIKDFPREVERAFILTRLKELERYLGRNDPTLRGLLAGRSAEELATFLADSSALADTSGFKTLFSKSYMSSKDPSVPVINALGPLYFTLGQQNDQFAAREDNLNASLARARFEVFGTDLPPDATFSLRLSDGVVRGYAYNGTMAPPVTTYYGLYDHYFTYGQGTDWDLPERWLTPPAEFDMSTPLNLISTNDISGGSSGSPLLNQNLEIVGLVFDGNIESLPNEYLYRDEQARTIAVDARGMLEALRVIYDANRLVLELRTGQLAASEEEADALLQGVGKR